MGDISNSFSGGTPKVGVAEYYGGKIPFIRSGEISQDFTELFITQIALNNSSAKMVSKGNILYALYGATSGEVSISKISGAINQAILAIIPKSNFSSKFICYQLRKLKNHIYNTYLQGGQGNLSAGIITSLNLLFPSFDEQKKIGDFFYNFDELISSKQQEIIKHKTIKQSLFTKMFVN